MLAQYWEGYQLKNTIIDSVSTGSVLTETVEMVFCWALRYGSSPCSKTPCSSWRIIHDSCMLTAAPSIKAGDLSGPCGCPVGELWPHKYASNTFAVPIIESQPIPLLMCMILKAQHCVFGRYSSLNLRESHWQHVTWSCFVTTADGKIFLEDPHFCGH